MRAVSSVFVAETTGWSTLVNGLLSLGVAALAVAVDLWLRWVDRHPPKPGTFAYRHWEAAKRYSGFRHGLIRVAGVAFAAIGIMMILGAALMGLGAIDL